MVKRTVDPTGDRDTMILAGGALVLVVATVAAGWVSLHLAAWFTDRPQPADNPIRLIIDVASGRTHWTTAATTAAVILGVVVLAAVVATVLFWPKRSAGKRQRSDRSARYMARPGDLAHLTEAGATAKARRLGFPGAGLPLGKTLTGRQLFSSWEDTAVLIAGPRTQKTTAYAIPCVLAAPGACLATGNKRDLFDVTSAARAEIGSVWLFDPQRVAGGEPTWFWDPLSYIDRSETRAERLAGQIATAARPEEAKRDPYFDPEAESLLGLLLLAASLATEPITVVYEWLTKDSQDRPCKLLADHGYPLQGRALLALSRLPEKQREGVFGTARAFAGFLRNRELLPWITPAAGYDAWTTRRFDPREFARSSDTLYSLSDEGRAGSVGPVVAALTMAVLDALEEYATQQPRGRLAVPCVAVLDEAANVCKLRGLDDKYSHYGSRGIVPITILQSWHQGAQVWGDHGIEKLWSAANAKIYGGGVDDDRFLRRLSDLIGQAERVQRSANVGRGGRTVTRSTQLETILTPAELRELPAGRAVLFASGTPAVMLHPVPYYEHKQVRVAS